MYPLEDYSLISSSVNLFSNSICLWPEATKKDTVAVENKRANLNCVVLSDVNCYWQHRWDGALVTKAWSTGQLIGNRRLDRRDERRVGFLICRFGSSAPIDVSCRPVDDGRLLLAAQFACVLMSSEAQVSVFVFPQWTTHLQGDTSFGTSQVCTWRSTGPRSKWRPVNCPFSGRPAKWMHTQPAGLLNWNGLYVPAKWNRW